MLESKGILRTATEEFALSAKYHPEDVLAAECIRTCRSEVFRGRDFLMRVEALAQGNKKIEMRTLLPEAKHTTPALDVVSMYGFRPKLSDLWYLSPWEFTQWFFCHKLKPPNKEYSLTMLTKQGCEKVGKETLIAGEDYVLNEVEYNRLNRRSTHLFRLPDSVTVFAGAPRVFYEQLRNSWLIIKRETPVVPCPTQTVLPTRRMSKHQRAKLYNVYLRPWTLFEKLADEDVLFAGDFGVPSANSVGTVRQQWKGYMQNILPHALRTVRNFMANSWAESHRDEDDDDLHHGPTMTYAMTLADVERVVAGDRKPLKTQDDDTNKVMSRVQRSTDVAMSLCKLQSTDASFHKARTEVALHRHGRLKISHAVQREDNQLSMPSAKLQVVRRDWRVIEAVYDTWYHEVYVDTSSKVPTAQQKMILTTVHLRRKYEYFIEQNLPLTDDIINMSTTPLYRLIHGLPGAGKSQVLLWLRDYFERVWGWVHGDQFVFLGAMNSMADNIGGFTMHSYFAISFMDNRGMT